MLPFKVETIDDIKERYEFTIDTKAIYDTADIVYTLLKGKFFLVFEQYKFDDKLIEINKILESKRESLDKNTLESIENTLNEISLFSKKIQNEFQCECKETLNLLIRYTIDFEDHKKVAGASTKYKKLSTDTINKEVKKFIKYEKYFSYYNDNLINIKKIINN